MARRRSISVKILFEPKRENEQALQQAYQCVVAVVGRGLGGQPAGRDAVAPALTRRVAKPGQGKR